MEDEIRQRRLQLQEKKKADELKVSLSGLLCHDFHAREDIPTWIHVEIKRFLMMDSDPDGRIDKNVGALDRLEWIRTFIDRWDVGRRFYLLVPFNFLPWLDCEIRAADWLDSILRMCEPTVNVVMVASNFSRVIAIFEEEYEYIAFVASRDAVVVP